MKERDPLSYWHHSSAETRRCSELAGQGYEVALRKPNVSGGTEWGAAYVLSCIQGRQLLDGVPIPRLDTRRPDGVVCSLDYKQQVLSVQSAYTRLLGDWPHKVTERSGEIIRTMRVMQVGGGDDARGWPALHFLSQENPRAGVGVRGDVFHFDEPPKESVLREMRKAPHPGRNSVFIITYTPLVRSQWEAIERDYQGCMDVPYKGRVMVWLNDLRKCSHLSPADIQRLEDAYRGDPLAHARLTGEPIDVSGQSPWGALYSVLDEMAAEWGEEPRLVPWQITRETDGEQGRAKAVEQVTLEVWRQHEGKRAYVDIDPSLGIDAPNYDPGGLHLSGWDSGDLWLRYNGYVGAYGLGSLAAGIGRQYGMALADPETTGGYGGPCLTALGDAGYGNVAKQQRETRPGTWETQLGFQTTTETRPAMIEAIREWMKAYRAGHKYARCPSRAVLQSLKDLILDNKGKPVAAPGLHDEDVILWGQKLRKLRPGRYHVPLPLSPAVRPATFILNLGPTVPRRPAPVRMKSRPN
jgi:hypothetical protein